LRFGQTIRTEYVMTAKRSSSQTGTCVLCIVFNFNFGMHHAQVATMGRMCCIVAQLTMVRTQLIIANITLLHPEFFAFMPFRGQIQGELNETLHANLTGDS